MQPRPLLQSSTTIGSHSTPTLRTQGNTANSSYDASPLHTTPTLANKSSSSNTLSSTPVQPHKPYQNRTTPGLAGKHHHGTPFLPHDNPESQKQPHTILKVECNVLDLLSQTAGLGNEQIHEILQQEPSPTAPSVVDHQTPTTRPTDVKLHSYQLYTKSMLTDSYARIRGNVFPYVRSLCDDTTHFFTQTSLQPHFTATNRLLPHQVRYAHLTYNALLPQLLHLCLPPPGSRYQSWCKLYNSAWYEFFPPSNNPNPTTTPVSNPSQSTSPQTADLTALYGSDLAYPFPKQGAVPQRVPNHTVQKAPQRPSGALLPKFLDTPSYEDFDMGCFFATTFSMEQSQVRGRGAENGSGNAGQDSKGQNGARSFGNFGNFGQNSTQNSSNHHQNSTQNHQNSAHNNSSSSHSPSPSLLPTDKFFIPLTMLTVWQRKVLERLIVSCGGGVDFDPVLAQFNINTSLSTSIPSHLPPSSAQHVANLDRAYVPQNGIDAPLTSVFFWDKNISMTNHNLENVLKVPQYGNFPFAHHSSLSHSSASSHSYNPNSNPNSNSSGGFDATFVAGGIETVVLGTDGEVVRTDAVVERKRALFGNNTNQNGPNLQNGQNPPFGQNSQNLQQNSQNDKFSAENGQNDQNGQNGLLHPALSHLSGPPPGVYPGTFLANVHSVADLPLITPESAEKFYFWQLTQNEQIRLENEIQNSQKQLSSRHAKAISAALARGDITQFDLQGSNHTHKVTIGDHFRDGIVNDDPLAHHSMMSDLHFARNSKNSQNSLQNSLQNSQNSLQNVQNFPQNPQNSPNPLSLSHSLSNPNLVPNSAYHRLLSAHHSELVSLRQDLILDYLSQKIEKTFPSHETDLQAPPQSVVSESGVFFPTDDDINAQHDIGMRFDGRLVQKPREIGITVTRQQLFFFYILNFAHSLSQTNIATFDKAQTELFKLQLSNYSDLLKSIFNFFVLETTFLSPDVIQLLTTLIYVWFESVDTSCGAAGVPPGEGMAIVSHYLTNWIGDLFHLFQNAHTFQLFFTLPHTATDKFTPGQHVDVLGPVGTNGGAGKGPNGANFGQSVPNSPNFGQNTKNSPNFSLHNNNNSSVGPIPSGNGFESNSNHFQPGSMVHSLPHHQNAQNSQNFHQNQQNLQNLHISQNSLQNPFEDNIFHSHHILPHIPSPLSSLPTSPILSDQLGATSSGSGGALGPHNWPQMGQNGQNGQNSHFFTPFQQPIPQSLTARSSSIPPYLSSPLMPLLAYHMMAQDGATNGPFGNVLTQIEQILGQNPFHAIFSNSLKNATHFANLNNFGHFGNFGANLSRPLPPVNLLLYMPHYFASHATLYQQFLAFKTGGMGMGMGVGLNPNNQSGNLQNSSNLNNLAPLLSIYNNFNNSQKLLLWKQFENFSAQMEVLKQGHLQAVQGLISLVSRQSQPMALLWSMMCSTTVQQSTQQTQNGQNGQNGHNFVQNFTQTTPQVPLHAPSSAPHPIHSGPIDFSAIYHQLQANNDNSVQIAKISPALQNFIPLIFISLSKPFYHLLTSQLTLLDLQPQLVPQRRVLGLGNGGDMVVGHVSALLKSFRGLLTPWVAQNQFLQSVREAALKTPKVPIQIPPNYMMSAATSRLYAPYIISMLPFYTQVPLKVVKMCLGQMSLSKKSTTSRQIDPIFFTHALLTQHPTIKLQTDLSVADLGKDFEPGTYFSGHLDSTLSNRNPLLTHYLTHLAHTLLLFMNDIDLRIILRHWERRLVLSNPIDLENGGKIMSPSGQNGANFGQIGQNGQNNAQNSQNSATHNSRLPYHQNTAPAHLFHKNLTHTLFTDMYGQTKHVKGVALDSTQSDQNSQNDQNSQIYAHNSQNSLLSSLPKRLNPVSHQHSHLGYFCIKRPSTTAECYEVAYDEEPCERAEGKKYHISPSDDFACNNGFNWSYRAHCPLHDDVEVARIHEEVNGGQGNGNVNGANTSLNQASFQKHLSRQSSRRLGAGHSGHASPFTTSRHDLTIVHNNNSNPIHNHNHNHNHALNSPPTAPSGPIDKSLMLKDKSKAAVFNVYDYYTNNKATTVKHNLLHWVRQSILPSKGNDGQQLIQPQVVWGAQDASGVGDIAGVGGGDGSNAAGKNNQNGLFLNRSGKNNEKSDLNRSSIFLAEVKLVGIYNDLMTNLRMGGRQAQAQVNASANANKATGLNGGRGQNDQNNGQNGQNGQNSQLVDQLVSPIMSRRPDMTPFNNRVVNLVKALGKGGGVGGGSQTELRQALNATINNLNLSQNLQNVQNVQNLGQMNQNSSFSQHFNQNGPNSSFSRAGQKGKSVPGAGAGVAGKGHQNQQKQHNQQNQQNSSTSALSSLEQDPYAHLCLPEPNHLKLAEQYFIQSHVTQFMTQNGNGLAQNRINARVPYFGANSSQFSLSSQFSPFSTSSSQTQTLSSPEPLYQPLFNPLPLTYQQYTTWRDIYQNRNNATMVHFLDQAFVSTHYFSLLRDQLILIIAYLLTLAEYQRYLCTMRSRAQNGEQKTYPFNPPFVSTIGMDPEDKKTKEIEIQNHLTFKRMCETRYDHIVPSGLSSFPTTVIKGSTVSATASVLPAGTNATNVVGGEREGFEANIAFAKQCIQIVGAIQYLFPLPKLDLTKILNDYCSKYCQVEISQSQSQATGAVTAAATTSTTTTGPFSNSMTSPFVNKSNLTQTTSIFDLSTATNTTTTTNNDPSSLNITLTENLNQSVGFFSSPLKKKIPITNKAQNIQNAQNAQNTQNTQNNNQSPNNLSQNRQTTSGPVNIDDLTYSQWQRQPYKSTRPTPLQAIVQMTRGVEFRAVALMVIAIVVYCCASRFGAK